MLRGWLIQTAIGIIDDGINYVDEDAYAMKLHNQMYSCYDPVQVSTTLCQSSVLYRNDNYGDWLQ